jgi:RNA polymerase sigma-70 factor (ECF subfamily)
MRKEEMDRRWEQWMDRHLDALLLYARTQTFRESDAEDLVQQALAEVMGESEPALPLVYTIIRRRAIDLGRSNAARWKRESAAAEFSPAWLEPDLEDRDAAALIAQEVGKLPPAHQEVLALHLWSGLTFREIGEILGIPLHTAASRFKAALTSLRPGLVELDPNATSSANATLP